MAKRAMEEPDDGRESVTELHDIASIMGTTHGADGLEPLHPTINSPNQHDRDSDARRIADELRASGKFNDPAEVKRRATQVVAQGADPAAEHARLAMALGYTGAMPGTAVPAAPAHPGLHAAMPATAPPAVSGGGLTKADVERIVAAAVKVNPPPTGGGG